MAAAHRRRSTTRAGLTVAAALVTACASGGRADDSISATGPTTATDTGSASASTSTSPPPTTTATTGPTGSASVSDTGGPCATAEDCAEGQYCSMSGECLADGTCQVDGDCGGGDVCVDGGCQPAPPCADDNACDPGLVCAVSGQCVPEGTCGEDADCPEGQFCTTTGTCVPEGGCVTSFDCDAGMICNAEQVCEPGGMCGAQEFGADPVAPNILIVLDRSCSMKDKIGGVSKWAHAVGALDQILTTYDGLIRWGLILFPDIEKPNCQQGTIPIPLGDDNEAAIQGLLNSALVNTDDWFPNGPCVTNIDTGMTQAATDPALFAPDAKSYILLISDGAQAGCSAADGDKGTEMVIADLYSQGVPTYVVGFGGQVSKKQLNIFAELGGVPLPGDPKYYQADDAAELAAAFMAIAGGVISCTYQLDQTPPDWADVHVFFNDILEVPYDPTHTDGWDYDAMTNTITFYGSFCDELKANTVWDIDVVFGCETSIPG